MKCEQFLWLLAWSRGEVTRPAFPLPAPQMQWEPRSATRVSPEPKACAWLSPRMSSVVPQAQFPHLL